MNLLDVRIRDSELILSCRLPFALGHDMARQFVRVGSGDAGVEVIAERPAAIIELGLPL